MTEVTSIPSRRIRVIATSARWALGLLASAWLAMGLLWGGLHFFIVPRIGDFRPWMEQQASALLGTTVRIGEVQAQSNGLIPSIALRDVRLFDAQGREALHLPTVLAAFSPRSALALGFEQLYVERPELDIRRTRDGRIWIAGFALPQSTGPDTPAADWLFAQSELAIRHGKVRWTDELRDLVPLELDDVDLVLRKRQRTHTLRVDANPPAGWGQRLTLMGDFKQPLLARHEGNWRDWTGQLYAFAQQVDVSELRQYVDLGLELTQGRGALRVWADVDHAHITSATADVALTRVVARVSPQLEPLDFSWVAGRLGRRMLEGGQEFSTQGLSFDTRDGLHWPGGNLRLALFDGGSEPARPERGELVADRLDLAAMREIAGRLPLAALVRERLAELAPQGLVETLKLTWQGDTQQFKGFTAKGRVTQFAVQATSAVSAPGVRGADIDFDLNQNNGRASVAIRNGALDLPGVLEEPNVELSQLSADVQWKRDGQRLSVDVSKLAFSNADGQGEAFVKWQRDVSGPTANDRGFIDLQGSLSRLEGVSLHRYLPLAMEKDGRDYLRQALLGGSAAGVKFKVRGDLSRFPFETARQGEFRVSANVKDASFAFAPPLVMPRDSPPWPALAKLSGELVIDHDVLSVKATRGEIMGSPGLQISKGDATLTDLYGATNVAVTVQAKGPLGEALTVVNSSPVSVWTNKVLARSSASGIAEYRLKLAIPVDHVDKSTVEGSVTLAGNEFQMSPDIPRLVRARGVVSFNENGFTVTGGQARALGGDVRIDGGLSTLALRSVPQASQGAQGAARAAAPVLRLQGTATAEGIRQARELGPLARLGQFSAGSTAYSITVGLRAGVPELLLTSNLSGLSLSLPPPFVKATDAALPLRIESALLRSSLQPGARLQEQLQIDLGRLASVAYVRDTAGAESKVLRGSIAVGLAADESAPMPADGVAANISVSQLDLDAWTHVFSQIAGEAGTGAISAVTQSYLPNTLALRAKSLLAEGRQINNVVIGGSRDGLLWRANLDATELGGYVEYRQPSGPTQGRLYARLSRMVIGQSAAQDVENLLDQQPASIPALDIVVDDFELRGKKLGRIEVLATNLGSGNARDPSREWRLNRFNISNPEATLTASGNWANVNAQSAASTSKTARERRRTVLNFKLDVADSGDLLARLGMPGVIAKGKGKIEGQVSWLGSPITPDFPSMGGGFNVNMESGQFLKAEPGIAKLFGVLSLQSLPRRLTLDFRDVFSDGFAFDFVRGDATIDQGIARTNNLQMKGVNAAVMMEGQADIAKETQLLKVVVIPDINAGSASLIASTINPLVGLTTFLAQYLLRRPLMEASTQEFQIDGTWIDPRVTKVDRKP